MGKGGRDGLEGVWVDLYECILTHASMYMYV